MWSVRQAINCRVHAPFFLNLRTNQLKKLMVIDLFYKGGDDFA